ncbi:SpoIIE family protein phosphatase [Streptomyces diastatochromogenes]|uniref:SpoIIE family protein phosphatase n=1 Tax=Streptomyces diastatochromogenes TaxID=42236 RepID=UPI0039BF4FEE
MTVGGRSGRGPRSRWRPVSARSVAGQVFLLQWLIVVLLVVSATVVLVWQTRTAGVEAARGRSLACAVAVAGSADTAAALRTADPTTVLQPVTQRIGPACGVDFVTVLGTDGIRYTDPRPSLIGQRASGDFRRALAGQSYTERFKGAPSDAVRAVVPVQDRSGKVVGIVTTGVQVTTLSAALDRVLPIMAAGAVGALALATVGGVWVSRRLSLQTRGLGPREVTRMYEHHDAVLHSVREGVLVFDGERRLTLANDEARRLLALPDDVEGRHLDELRLPQSTKELLSSDRVATDEVHMAGDRLVAINHRPTGGRDGPAGSVTTLRDTTELQALAGRAATAAQRLELIYDAAVRIGTTLDVVRTAEELAQVAVGRFADVVTVDLLDAVVSGEEPAPGTPTTMRRVAVAGVAPGQALHEVGGRVTVDPATPQGRGLAYHRAILVPDLAASTDWRLGAPEFAERALRAGFHSMISVPLRARGTVLGTANFWRRGPQPFSGEDVDPAEELVARAAVCVDNARRYTREHALAVALQRSLLPGRLPAQNAVEAAYRYLPAQAGVGGDWFDVIPLPGARVALVVGDVVGHGLHATATMGRLRTAIHNFSALDQSPEELLAHLDELVVRIDQDPAPGAEAEPVTGATLLYVVYDSSTGTCEVARAGHVPPVLVHPDGTVEMLDVPANLPLGWGTAPFETHTRTLRPGSKLVLYTDGLVERRNLDVNDGLDRLQHALARPGRTSEQTCADVCEALLPEHPQDDIALMVATTRCLAPDRIAQWDVAPDPAAVAPVRAACVRWMTQWDLGDAAFTAELILSELITNAVRYGAPPITVRLLYDRDLTCEVSDASSTAPHVRRATANDEGGRGLFLVAQLAAHWGTRYTAHGKTIWTEHTITPQA